MILRSSSESVNDTVAFFCSETRQSFAVGRLTDTTVVDRAGIILFTAPAAGESQIMVKTVIGKVDFTVIQSVDETGIFRNEGESLS